MPMASGKILRSLVRNARRAASRNFRSVAGCESPSSHLPSISSSIFGVSRFRFNGFGSPRFFSISGHAENYLDTLTIVFSNTNETAEENKDSDPWEDDKETEPEYGDGGAGGGIVLQNVRWGERVLSIAREVLLQFGNDMELYAFKTTRQGYIYVRLDKLPNKYGCPDMDEIEKYHQEYQKKLDEAGEAGDIPHNLGVEVSSPGERLVRIPDDLNRFKDLLMRVHYVEDELKNKIKESVLLLQNVDTESGICEWKLVDVTENRYLTCKGRPLNRKLRDWRLKLPFAMFRKASLYEEKS